MNDILLTHDQQGAAIDIALERCTRDRELSAVHTVAEEVARAQVRKVADYWRSLPVAGRPMAEVHNEFMQALKAAGEKEVGNR